MRLTFREFELPLRHVFTISRSSTRTIRTLIVELEHDGLRGFGEAGEDEFYGTSIAKMKESLEAVRPLIESRPPCEPAELWAELAPKFGGNTFAQCALDQAVWDLWGKVQGSPVWRLWGLDASRLPVTDYTIGIDQVDVMVGKMEEFPGWPVYKIKLGTPQDLEIVGRLRHHSDAVFRVDANCAWTADEALRDAGVEASRGGIHRTAAAAGGLGRHAATVPPVGSADHRRRELPDRAGRRSLRGVFPRGQRQARQVRRADSGQADDRPRAIPRHEDDGRLHGRVDGEHLGERPAPAASGLRRYRRRPALG